MALLQHRRLFVEVAYPKLFGRILINGQEETNRSEGENLRRHESAQHERKLTPGPRSKLIAAGHAFVEIHPLPKFRASLP